MAGGGLSSTSSISGPGMAIGLIVAVLGLSMVAAYVWNTHGVGAADGRADEPVAVEARDENGDGRAGWIALTLTEAASGPYRTDQVHLMLSDPDDTAMIDRADPSDARDRILCTEPAPNPGAWLARRACSRSWFQVGSLWSAGETLYVPCQEADDGEGTHEVRVRLRGRPAVDRTVNCEQAAPFGG